jgi:hypothetical protein
VTIKAQTRPDAPPQWDVTGATVTGDITSADVIHACLTLTDGRVTMHVHNTTAKDAETVMRWATGHGLYVNDRMVESPKGAEFRVVDVFDGAGTLPAVTLHVQRPVPR